MVFHPWKFNFYTPFLNFGLKDQWNEINDSIISIIVNELVTYIKYL